MMILTTKLFAPPASSRLVERGRLLDKLKGGLERPVTLVSAPAGFGKSTLLSVWIAEMQASTDFSGGWLSLDAQDNAAAQFWTYFVAAWQSALPGSDQISQIFLDQIHSLLSNDDKKISEGIVGALVHLMQSVQESTVIVLDDYHQIQNPEIHHCLAQLIERLPQQVRLAIATRYDPPLPIPRWRVREQLNEVRAADLRFTATEIEALFREVLGDDFTDQDLAALETSTEGWAAGLKMAALALQSHNEPTEDRGRLWSALTGQNIYILDYLAEEVLGRLPEESQSFLIKTSLLNRLTGELCAAVALEDKPPSVGREILEQFERANLFLIPLDAERGWFRYHHLFGDLLRARLLQRYGEQIPALHKRAAAWFEQQGWIEEAAHHAIAAQDWEIAARLMEEHVNSYLDQGQLATVLKWVESLPPWVLRRRPNLCIQVAWALGHAGKTDRIAPMLAEADAALKDWGRQQSGEQVEPPLQMTEADAVRIRASLAIFRAYGLILAAQPEQALRLAETALVLSPDLEGRELAWLTWIAGYAHRGMGDIEQATLFFQRAVETGRTSGKMWEHLSTDLGIVYRLSGKLENAAQVFEDSLLHSEQSGQRNKGNLSRVEAYLSAVRMEQNRVEEGLEHARKAVDYLQWWPSHNHIATAYAFSSQAHLSIGALEEAEEALHRADQEHRKGQVTPFVTRLIESTQVKLWLARQDISTLQAWSDCLPIAPPANPSAALYSEYEEMQRIALAQAWIGLGRMGKDPQWLEQAVCLLEGLAISADKSRRVHAAIEIYLLGALAMRELANYGKGRGEQALTWLNCSLRMGLPAGYKRVYLSEGHPMRDLLQEWLRKDRGWIESSGVKVEAVLELLYHLTQAPEKHPGGIEPLTEREKDVLQLLMQGLSNREMAGRLFVSEGTVKTHVHNLIAKLGVQSRTQVLARALELNLLKEDREPNR